jgi:hypothetical protein
MNVTRRDFLRKAFGLAVAAASLDTVVAQLKPEPEPIPNAGPNAGQHSTNTTINAPSSYEPAINYLNRARDLANRDVSLQTGTEMFKNYFLTLLAAYDQKARGENREGSIAGAFKDIRSAYKRRDAEKKYNNAMSKLTQAQRKYVLAVINQHLKDVMDTGLRPEAIQAMAFYNKTPFK